MRNVKRISALHLILMLSLFLNIVGIWWGLPSLHGGAPDEIFPSRVLDGLLRFYSNDWYDKYPPFHFYLLSLLYAPFYLLHELHVLDLRQLSSYAILFCLGRLLSVAMATAIIYLVYKIGEEILDRRAALWSALITALIVPFEYYAKMINLDIPYLFWFALSLLFFIRILKTHQRKDYLLFTAAAVLAVCTKDQAYGLYVLAPLTVIFSDRRHKRKLNPSQSLVRFLFDRTYFLCLILAAGIFFFSHNILFNARGFIHHVNLIIGPASRDFRMYANTAAGHLQLFWLTLRHIRFSLGWPLFIVCTAGLLISLLLKKKNPFLLSLLVFAFSYYVFYVAVIRYDYDRFNIPICMILSFFGGRLLSDVLSRRQRFFKVKTALAAALFIYAVLYSFSVDALMVADSRYSVEKWMRTNIPRDAAIGVASPDEYGPRMEGFSRRSLPLSLPAFKELPKPDYVLFNTDYSRAFEEGSPEHRFFSGFADGNVKYKLVFRHRTALPCILLKYDNIMTNIKTINPEIKIYRRLGPATDDSLGDVRK